MVSALEFPCLKRGQSEDTMAEEHAATDAALGGLPWVVGERYEVHDAVDRLVVTHWSWLPYAGEASRLRQDASRNWHEVRRDNYTPAQTECWVRLISDVTPDLRTTRARAWEPSRRPGLADELADLRKEDEAAILAWVRANGFIGVRGNVGDRSESVEEIR